MEKPNFVIFLTDDQGYGDLSCMGSRDFKTPSIDRLAETGARFINWYSNSPVCSPSRASLLTGRYPGNAGVRSILAGHRTTAGLPKAVPTLTEALKPLGYRTGMFGKWHLGLKEGSRPEDHGFDEWFGFMAGCIDYYSHIFYWGMSGGVSNPTHDLWENGCEVYENGRYFTELITEKATSFIRRAVRNDDKSPFFLYVPYNAPHYPMHAPSKYTDRFPDLPWDRQIMAAMLSAVDDSVGEIIAELKRQGADDNTVIFFMSDNGPSREARNWMDGRPDPYYGGTTGIFKGHKFSLYEGGLRSPAILNWPKQIPPRQVIDGMAAAMDIFPTFYKIAGGNPEDFRLDGLDILPMVCGGAPSPHRELFWEMGGQTAIRRGKWKLVLHGQLVEGAPVEDEAHLSDLDLDPGERVNLRGIYPGLTDELRKAAEEWRRNIEENFEQLQMG